MVSGNTVSFENRVRLHGIILSAAVTWQNHCGSFIIWLFDPDFMEFGWPIQSIGGYIIGYSVLFNFTTFNMQVV